MNSSQLYIENYINQKKELIENWLTELWPALHYPPEIFEAMEYCVMGGGKRLRPVLCLTTGEMFGADSVVLREIACALELIHTYSLIHDDLPAMDDDDYRRNRLTCHRRFDEATAILTGDALLTMAFELLATYGLKTGYGERALLITLEVAKASGACGMIGGQILDIQAEGKNLNTDNMEEISKLKTGALLQASVKTGAIAAGANPDEITALNRYAGAVGLAFQIVDDLLNFCGDAEKLGKNTGTDKEKGKATYPLSVGEETSRRRVDTLYEISLRELEQFGEAATPLRQLAHRLVYRNK